MDHDEMQARLDMATFATRELVSLLPRKRAEVFRQRLLAHAEALAGAAGRPGSAAAADEVLALPRALDVWSDSR